MPREAWHPIDTAPRTGATIRIRGKRFITDKPYTAQAVWATRRCPAEVEDWFPPTPDRGGPYMDVTGWLPLN